MTRVLIIGHRGTGKSRLLRLILEQHRIQLIEQEKAERDVLLIGGGLNHLDFNLNALSSEAKPILKKTGWHELNKRHISKKQRRKL